ncbi:CoA-acylating methylmalonate-semialdehyde dehydrogenase [Microbacterium horticulturae]|uniref:methylmalonate-semialdehyde dehydrogenase (CoA acylating) n=1 Tax=Microbacterium horticulturae TaxID=3028316 RepID=A0ABY8C473_9MICO|nr:CoA-acylating methylmalonate-semialdehyde dehydrogenase [Microbacterium sp. KACC 23027]WEG10132.1 CoA-acylating methylmalonate-semialdehyde dehydrogenase [Microbacterium sp. KACC 23027]
MTTVTETTTLTQIPHVIGGQRVDPGERRGTVYNPSHGVPTGEIGLADAALVAEAARVAAEAQKKWRDVGLVKRAQMMFRVREIITSRAEELARIITAEHGKTVADALGEVARGLENVEFCTGLMHHLKGEYSEQIATGLDVHQVRQPLGVVACITPFNFPAMLPLWMVPTAIAAGNAVILKPSERDPSAAVWLADAFREAGLPDGVLNVVHGDKGTVDAILADPTIKAVSFVGSTPIAKYIYTEAAAHGKRVQALGGAKNHMVVMPDADLDAAADAAVSAGFGSAGERCMAISAVVAVGDVGDELVAKVAERMKGLKIGDGFDPDNEIGPLITDAARERVRGFVAGAEPEGARLVVDGREQQFDSDGFFLGASLVDEVKPGMAVYDEEVFGPVLSVVRVDSYDEAVQMINDNPYGNGTAIFTRDGKTARQFEYDIQVGMVGINVPIPVPVGSFSFGGWKNSLFGDTHMYGSEAFNFYTRRKVVTSRWPEPSESQISLGFPTH